MAMLNQSLTAITSDPINTRSSHHGSSLAITMPPQDRSRDDPPSPPPQPPPSPAHWSRFVSIDTLAPLDI
ncbi:hypothetical protein COCC4DRAFT_69767 [Bipolaris maydis ATCC 48331]|uniref:Uncharacterized protein n=2 Tax=Cochliobolus heterostrophus TaxID=5016 RepID=M2UFD8_COCH5|nr:uncharacterized protein COCC4DRAFT_69767 [Bipolaris maydis ATCC 48331]EMD92406.1 hypothetical protein COCHEDRAFT_1193895 [Bipolaris maydis C5]ENI08097.1 hypothetical protein COCC4DRAFT_69767 [Bipolaris maydis ATCC 48331]